nr:Zinc finger domain containing protein [Haemonchus contortus]
MQQSQFDQGQPVAYSSFFSQLPFGPPGFPFQDLDYHLQEGAANFRPSAVAENPADVPTSIADAGELQKHMTESKPIASYPQRRKNLVCTNLLQFQTSSVKPPLIPVLRLLPHPGTVKRHVTLCRTVRSVTQHLPTVCTLEHEPVQLVQLFFEEQLVTEKTTGYRKICRSCRLKRCMDIGMLPDNVQHKRCRRDSPTSTVPKPFNTMLQPFCSHIPDGNIPRISSSI